ncbi:MAG: DNA repair protein RadA [Candidatus Muiribacterium halophilum]|uniref:DNA repair protein RadA n=1 Tax=Muiribacterium halophilum TaxID=2053465 RepID=A0A2N5ZD39_MUIH1|nr:MAG: DNA repair protein RadA [Candidatus Muirbacterium halophilum]
MYRCSECDHKSAQWYGKCPGCGEWNTFIEVADSGLSKGKKRSKSSSKAYKIKELKTETEMRFSSGISELDSVLGGGIVSGSVVLIGGHPGIGKSTLLMQVSASIAMKRKVLYITAEESATQVKLRAQRLNCEEDDIYILADYSLQNIMDTLDNIKPNFVVIDSIQTLKSENVGTVPGTIGQVRECASTLTEYAKSNNIPLFIVAQINKDGNIAGPKHLEHLVDTVLYFDESRDYSFRVLRSVKNRYGPANELGIFEMTSNGLIPKDEHILVGTIKELPGLQLVVAMEGLRSLVTEVQTLVSETGFSMPQRMAEGFDRNRLLFLLAVLEKKAGIFFRNQDVFLNVPGAVRLSDPAVELGVCVSLVSSFRNMSVNPLDYVFLGEVGLTGEIRSVPFLDKRLVEIKRLGIKNVVLAKPVKKIKAPAGVKLEYYTSVSEVVRKFFR